MYNYCLTGLDGPAVKFQGKKKHWFTIRGGGKKKKTCTAVFFVVLLASMIQGYSLGIWLAALARRTAPGLGYGLCWNRGPAAVVSAPVFASLRLGRPLDHEPLLTKNVWMSWNWGRQPQHTGILGVLSPCWLILTCLLALQQFCHNW